LILAKSSSIEDLTLQTSTVADFALGMGSLVALPVLSPAAKSKLF
jgi:hypothetical protein